MAKFIKLTKIGGGETLINTDFISEASFDIVNNDVLILTVNGERRTFTGMSFAELKEALKDDTAEKATNNLYHIWEILRARLH